MVRFTQVAGAAALFAPALVSAGIIARQVIDSTQFPEPCKTDYCIPLTEYLKTTPHCPDDLACRCSTPFANVLGPCVKCVMDTNLSSFDITSVEFFRRFHESCAASGFPSITLAATLPTSALVSATPSVPAISSGPLALPSPLPSVSASHRPGASASSPRPATATTDGALLPTSSADTTTWSMFGFTVAAVIGVAILI